MNLWSKEFRPMLLKEVDEPFNDKKYLFEIKYDGIRTIIFASPKSLVIKSRNGLDITTLFPELQSISELVKENVIFDGEIILFNDKKISFSSLQKRIHLKNKKTIEFLSKTNPVVFIAFDCLYEDKDLIAYPLEKRKKYLNKYSDSDTFIKSKYIVGEGCKIFKIAQKLNLEGIIAKEKSSLYKINERSDVWLKIKNYKEGYFYILGYIEKEYIVVLFLGEIVNKKIKYVGKVSLSKKRSKWGEILKVKPTKLKYDFIKDKAAITIKPEIKCFVKYLEKTENGILRQPFIP